ncbi:hypothetical protein L7F22_061382 [Adiantum nelumboides]|nr:hypothetical protein [Adiantum nelumboides]
MGGKLSKESFSRDSRRLDSGRRIESAKQLSRQYSHIGDDYGSIEQVTEALRKAGLESSNLIVGVDFTKSNEWTGKKSFNGRSLHALSENVMNPYEQAISIIGQTLSPFDDDNLIPCFGFGDARLAQILDAQKKGKKHGKKRRKSTDFLGYLGRRSTFDKAKKHKKRVRFAKVPSSSSSFDSSLDLSEEDRKGKKRSKKQQHRKGKKKARKSKSRRVDDSSTEDTSTDNIDSEDVHFYANKKNFYKANQYDFLEDKSKKVREFKEGGQSIKFDTFSGYKDALKALSFIQQFDIAFAGGRYFEHFKIRRAAETDLDTPSQESSTKHHFKTVHNSHRRLDTGTAEFRAQIIGPKYWRPQRVFLSLLILVQSTRVWVGANSQTLRPDALQSVATCPLIYTYKGCLKAEPLKSPNLKSL